MSGTTDQAQTQVVITPTYNFFGTCTQDPNPGPYAFSIGYTCTDLTIALDPTGNSIVTLVGWLDQYGNFTLVGTPLQFPSGPPTLSSSGGEGNVSLAVTLPPVPNTGAFILSAYVSLVLTEAGSSPSINIDNAFVIQNPTSTSFLVDLVSSVKVNSKILDSFGQSGNFPSNQNASVSSNNSPPSQSPSGTGTRQNIAVNVPVSVTASTIQPPPNTTNTYLGVFLSLTLGFGASLR